MTGTGERGVGGLPRRFTKMSGAGNDFLVFDERVDVGPQETAPDRRRLPRPDLDPLVEDQEIVSGSAHLREPAGEPAHNPLASARHRGPPEESESDAASLFGLSFPDRSTAETA